MGCSRGVLGLFRAVSECSRGVPGMFRGVPGVFWVLQTPVFNCTISALVLRFTSVSVFFDFCLDSP